MTGEGSGSGQCQGTAGPSTRTEVLGRDDRRGAGSGQCQGTAGPSTRTEVLGRDDRRGARDYGLGSRGPQIPRLRFAALGMTEGLVAVGSGTHEQWSRGQGTAGPSTRTEVLGRDDRRGARDWVGPQIPPPAEVGMTEGSQVREQVPPLGLKSSVGMTGEGLGTRAGSREPQIPRLRFAALGMTRQGLVVSG